MTIRRVSSIVRRGLSLASVLIALALTCPQAARAGGVVSTCSEAAFKAAVFTGGNITFSCSGTITVLGGTITISKNTTIDGSGHSVTISGGGKVQIFIVDSGITLNLTRITVADGNATDSNGGGVLNNGTLNVTHSTFRGNTAQPQLNESIGGNGGGIYNHAYLNVTNSTFDGNTASESGEGGGIFNDNDATINNSSFHNNQANSGGAIFTGSSNEGGLLVVKNSVFSNNQVTGSGGGIFNQGFITVVTNSTFYANGGTSAVGGNIYNCCNTKGTALLDNDTIAGGIAASGEGGNVSNVNDRQQPGTLFLENTIVTNASAGGNCNGTVTDGGGNLRFPTSDPTCVGSYGNPKLGMLQNNGGPTQTMALLKGSNAIDTAIDGLCPPTDQRGVIRLQGPHCDIGAYEYNTAFSLGLALQGKLNAFLVSLLSEGALDKLSDRVITPLEHSLDSDLWPPEGDGNHVNGREVFTLQRDVVDSLSALIVDPTQLAYIDNLVMADRTLAVVAFNDKGCGGDANLAPNGNVSRVCSQAAADLAAGDASAGMGDYSEAIGHYFDAWQVAQ